MRSRKMTMRRWKKLRSGKVQPTEGELEAIAIWTGVPIEVLRSGDYELGPDGIVRWEGGKTILG